MGEQRREETDAARVPTITWVYSYDEDDGWCATGRRRGKTFRVVPYHDNSGACVQLWVRGNWRTLLQKPRANGGNATKPRGWKSFDAALRAVERGDCDKARVRP